MKADLQIILEEEVLLNQVLYKIHNQFHNGRGYKDLRMFVMTVRKLLAHHYVQKLEDLLSFLPSPLASLPTQARHLPASLQAAYCPLVRLLALLPGEEEVLKLPNNLYSLLPEDILGGMEVKEETVEEVEMVEKRVASVDSFLDIGVPVKRLKTVETMVAEVKPKDSLSDIHRLEGL